MLKITMKDGAVREAKLATQHPGFRETGKQQPGRRCWLLRWTAGPKDLDGPR